MLREILKGANIFVQNFNVMHLIVVLVIISCKSTLMWLSYGVKWNTNYCSFDSI